MNAIQQVHVYPENIFFGKEAGEEIPLKYSVVSFFGREEGHDFDFYIRVTRIKDGAYQILKGLEDYPVALFNDADCRHASHIHIADRWTYPRIKQARTESVASTDSIGVPINKKAGKE